MAKESREGFDIAVNLTESIDSRIHTIKSEDDLQRLRDIRALLVMKTNYYRAEKQKFKSLLDILHLNDTDLSHETQTMVSELALIQEEFKIKNCDSESISLSTAERRSKHIFYLAKLKLCNTIYNKLIQKIADEIKFTQSELQYSHLKCNYLSSSNFVDQIRALNIKIEKHQAGLNKFEKKYPWLRDRKFNFQAISEEMENLKKLRNEKDQLLSELDFYKGLKPDINEALQQYAEIKLKYAKMFR